MRLSRFFIDAPLSLGEHELPEAQAHYIGRVLRMAEGDALQVFDDLDEDAVYVRNAFNGIEGRRRAEERRSAAARIRAALNGENHD